MADDGNTRTSEGVQALISRLRDEGVQSGREEAERLVTQAREEAARIVEAARAEAETLRSRATSDAARASSAMCIRPMASPSPGSISMLPE